MEQNRRYTTMVLPQGFDGQKLRLNIVLIPRNQDPFVKQPTGLPAPDDTATSFADLKPVFEINIVKNPDGWPVSNSSLPGTAPEKIIVNVKEAVNKKALLESITTNFGLTINVNSSDDTIEEKEFVLNKYLPESYRNSFNFTSPRVRNAKTDDSYHCAIKKKVDRKPDWKNSDKVSWGQVYAHILRQPLLAKACGMIYSVELPLTEHPDWFKKGGYIFAEIVNEEYAHIQNSLLQLGEPTFVKPYAARIPKLTISKKRPVFAPVVIPVLYETEGIVPEPKGPWDEIFAEINEYNDGFSKIIHAAQPISTNLLSEQQDGHHPVNDAGIRVAWDDEQILIWYLRQMTFNPEEANKRLDAPLGVFGYKMDVRKAGSGNWHSLNMVKSRKEYAIGNVAIGNKPGELIELPYQVFPTQLDNDQNGPFWLPMYFTNWIGKSLVLKDTDAIAIYKNNEEVDAGGNQKVEDANQFDEVTAAAELRYGKAYEFRVRMMDLSGGGPKLDDSLFNNAPSPHAKLNFKRFVAPGLCNIEQPQEWLRGETTFFNEFITAGKSEYTGNPVLKIMRPVLTYPAIVFTGKYPNPVDLLIQDAQKQAAVKDLTDKARITPGLPDPDVTWAAITVEVETLKLDNLLSKTGNENYIVLYKTQRKFPKKFDQLLNVPVQFIDVNVLNFDEENDPFNDPSLSKTALDAMDDLVFPTARRIRVTVRAQCEDQPEYFGFTNNGQPDLDSRYGKQSQLLFYKESAEEKDFLLPQQNTATIKGIYLQPDPPQVVRQSDLQFVKNRESANAIPDIVERLALQLGVASRGLTLMSKKGERVVFACSNKIQHHLSPDHSSITFGTKNDLSDHWMAGIVYRINRDWSWDGLKDVSISIKRNKRWKKEGAAIEEIHAGDIELKRNASFESLQPDEYGNVARSHTTFVFIDAIDPKRTSQAGDPGFPAAMEIKYTLTPNVKEEHGSLTAKTTDVLLLPTTVNPSQTPEICSVGFAFSRYVKNKNYSATETRQRYLWVELKEPVKDPQDTLFCRLIGYGPDPLLARNRDILPNSLKEPPLPIDAEYVRSIIPGQSDDMAGLGAMQVMEKAIGDDDLHYLLPLPPGLHSESPELFGFFSYEFRIGHAHWRSADKEKYNLWSTAQGRFGRPIKITGMQHPAPNLLCNVDHNKTEILVTAPYARAVLDGKDVTSDPPRTQLHCVLYAQVMQADGLEHRNILLSERLMEADRPEMKKPDLKSSAEGLRLIDQLELVTRLSASDKFTRAASLLSMLEVTGQLPELKLSKNISTEVKKILEQRATGAHAELNLATADHILSRYQELRQRAQLEIKPPKEPAAIRFTNASLIKGAQLAIMKDSIRTASCTWNNKEIGEILRTFGVPEDASLSVLAVEVFGNITNAIDMFNIRGESAARISSSAKEQDARSRGALSDLLGNYRILRTSPLTEVPAVCCTTC